MSMQQRQFIKKSNRGSSSTAATTTLTSSINSTNGSSIGHKIAGRNVSSASLFSVAAKSRRGEDLFVEPTVNDIPSKKKTAHDDDHSRRTASDENSKTSSKSKSRRDTPPDTTADETAELPAKAAKSSDKQALRNITNEMMAASRSASKSTRDKKQHKEAPAEVEVSACQPDVHDHSMAEVEIEIAEVQPRTSKEPAAVAKSSKSSKDQTKTSKSKEKEKEKERKKRRERSVSSDNDESPLPTKKKASQSKKTAEPAKSKPKKRPQEEVYQPPVHEPGCHMHIPENNEDTELRRSKRTRVDKNAKAIYGYEATEDAQGNIIVLSKIIGYQTNKYMDELRMARAMPGPITKYVSSGKAKSAAKSKAAAAAPAAVTKKKAPLKPVLESFDDQTAADDHVDQPAPASPLPPASVNRSVSLDSDAFNTSHINESQESVAIFDKRTRKNVGISSKTDRNRLLGGSICQVLVSKSCQSITVRVQGCLAKASKLTCKNVFSLKLLCFV